MISTLVQTTKNLSRNKHLIKNLHFQYSLGIRSYFSNSHQHQYQSKKSQSIFKGRICSYLIASTLLLGCSLYLSDRIQMKETQVQPLNSKIVYLTDPSDIQNLGLQGHALVWYQTLDNPTIDKQVEKILQKFIEKRSETIGTPFKVVIDKTQRASDKTEETSYYKKNCQIVIVKPDSLKPIQMNRYLNYKGASIQQNSYSILFNRISSQINEVHQINLTNIRQFANTLSNKATQAWVVMAAHSDSPQNYRKSKKKFKQFIKQKQAFGQHVQKAIVTDQQALRILGIDPTRAKQNQIFILTPPSDNISEQVRKVSIFGKKYHILTSWQISKFIFPPYLQKSHSDSLYLKVAIDANQNVSSELKNLYKTLKQLPSDSDLKSVPKYLVYQKDVSGKGTGISLALEKNNFDEIVSVYDKASRHNNDEKKKLLLGSNKWRYPYTQEINVQNLQKWYKSVKDGNQKQTFESQSRIIQASDVPIYKYHSMRITGQEYFDAITNNPKKPKVVFHFSPYCFSCKKFKHHFEDLAKEKGQQFDFYRINNDENKSSQVQNYNSTPIFVIYKRNPIDNKVYMFNYKNTIFTKKVFSDFLEITKDLNIFSHENFYKNIQDRKQCQNLMKQFTTQGGCSTV